MYTAIGFPPKQPPPKLQLMSTIGFRETGLLSSDLYLMLKRSYKEPIVAKAQQARHWSGILKFVSGDKKFVLFTFRQSQDSGMSLGLILFHDGISSNKESF